MLSREDHIQMDRMRLDGSPSGAARPAAWPRRLRPARLPGTCERSANSPRAAGAARSARFESQPHGGWRKRQRSRPGVAVTSWDLNGARARAERARALGGFRTSGRAPRGLPCSAAPSGSRSVSPGLCGSPVASVLAPASISKEKQQVQSGR